MGRDTRPPLIVALIVAAILQATVASSSAAELRCNVTNGTTGQPCSPDAFALMKLGKGMEEVESRTSPGAVFTIANLSKADQYLLQVAYKGVRYNSTIAFTGPELLEQNVTVYELSNDDRRIRISMLRVSLKLEAGWLLVNETIVAANDSKTVYTNDSKGALKFSLPSGFDNIDSVFVTSTHLPTRQDVVSLEGDPPFAVDYPLKPGRTEFNIALRTPYSSRHTFRQSFLYPVDSVEIFVMPSSTAVDGATVTPRGEAGEGIAAYAASALAAGRVLEFGLSGEAMAAAPVAPPGEAAPQTVETEIVEVPPALYRYKLHLILLMAGVMSLAFWFGLRERAPAARGKPKGRQS